MKKILSNFSRTYIQHRYRILFYSLMLTFAASPMLAVFDLDAELLHIFLVINVLIAIFGERRLRNSRTMIVIFVLVISGRVLASFSHLEIIALTVLPLFGMFAVATVGLLLRSSFATDKITEETLYAALSAYLISGLCMAFIYWSIEQALPNSFVVASSLTNTTFSIATAVYFSFVTLATLGYGDIVPNTELTRGLVIFQCISGQFYLVVMVARLVSLCRRHPEIKGDSTE